MPNNSLGLVPLQSEQGLAPYGIRHSGDAPKGTGWLGMLTTESGDVATEYSVEDEINGKVVEYPLLVPTLTEDEISVVLKGKEIPEQIYDKARSWAKTRIDNGKSPFKEEGELKMPPSEFAKGGEVMMQSRKLFADGGMMDNSGEQVNGVEVPPGSLKEEVADDIDAKLSEGEFVLPADVVRFIGLERLMKMRDKAKEGLARMEKIGQVGNAEDVGEMSDTPFGSTEDDSAFESDIDGIINEVNASETSDQTEKAFGSGGYVTGTDLSKASSNPMVDVRYFKHSDGRIIYITFINGKPMTAIPEGFSQTDKPTEQQVGKAADDAAEKAKAAADTTGGGEGGEGSPAGPDGTSSTGGAGGGITSTGTAPSTGLGATYGGIVSPSAIGKGLTALGAATLGPLGMLAGKKYGVDVAGSMNASAVASNLGVQGYSPSTIAAVEAAVEAASGKADATPGSVAAAAANALSSATQMDALDAMMSVTNSFGQGLDTTAVSAVDSVTGQQTSSAGYTGGYDEAGLGFSAAADAADAADAEAGAASAAAEAASDAADAADSADADAGNGGDDSGDSSGAGDGWAKGGLIKKRKSSKKQNKKGLVARK